MFLLTDLLTFLSGLYDLFYNKIHYVIEFMTYYFIIYHKNGVNQNNIMTLF